MDLIWGYTGILSLGHGVFFALGGYAMGMYLMRQIGRDGQYRLPMPDFMVFLDWKEFPWHWALSNSFVAQMALVVLAPGLLAFVFGFFAFRSRIKGVYFSIITQAMTFATMLLFFRNETGFGGNNGFTDFKRILGIPIATPSMRMTLFVAHRLHPDRLLPDGPRPSSAASSAACCRRSATPRAAVMFTGYDPLRYKLAIWTLSAVMCGIAGALYVPQVGIINPSEMSPATSIEIAIWVAVGGRGDAGRADRRRLLRQRREERRSPSSCPSTGCTCSARCSSPSRCSCRGGVVGLRRAHPRRARAAAPQCDGETQPDAGERVTPELMRAGADARRQAAQRAAARRAGSSGGRDAELRAAWSSPAQLDVAHGAILYLDDITRQLRRLQGAERALARASAPASCAASSARTAPARRR